MSGWISTKDAGKMSRRIADLERQLAEMKQYLVEADEKIGTFRDDIRARRQAAIDIEAKNEALRGKVSDADWARENEVTIEPVYGTKPLVVWCWSADDGFVP